MSLLANMDLRNSRINYLAKAKMNFEFAIIHLKMEAIQMEVIQSIELGFSPFLNK